MRFELFSIYAFRLHRCTWLNSRLHLVTVVSQVDSDLLEEFIGFHREYIDEKEIDFSKTGEPQMTSAMVLYFMRLLEYQNTVELPDDKEPKLFHVVPLCRVGLTNILIDNYVMYFVLDDVGLLDACDDGTTMTRTKFLELKMYEHYIANFFDVGAGQSQGEVKRREFPEGGAPCSTNGVKFCIGYHVNEHVEPGPHQRRKRGQIIKNPKSMIYQAVDPGRVQLLQTCKFVDGKHVESRGILSRKQYYNEIGEKQNERLTQRWQLSLREAHVDMSVNHCKFASPEKLTTGQKTVVKHYPSIWREMVKLRHENLNFSIHCRKRRSIALALNKLQKPDEPDTIVVYGAGSFASGKKTKSMCPSNGSSRKSRGGMSRPKWMSLELARCVPTAIRSSTPWPNIATTDSTK